MYNTLRGYSIEAPVNDNIKKYIAIRPEIDGGKVLVF
jgi:hypothetical protein